MYVGDLAVQTSTGRIALNGVPVFPTLAAFRSDVVHHMGRRYWYERLRHL
jgi:hypothetical protein